MTLWTIRSVHYFPVLLGLTLATGIVVSYIIAIHRGDVSVYMPFISEAGAKPPESGIFSLSLLLSVFIGFFCMLCRFFIVIEMNRGSQRAITILNIVSMVLGVLSLFGMALVGCYPVISDETAHMVGANILFLLGTVYAILQTVITYKMHPVFNGITICRIRLGLALASSLVLICMMFLYPLGKKAWKSDDPDSWKGNKEPGDEGFQLLLSSATAEWLLAILFIFFFFTFTREFQKVRINIHTNVLVTNFDDDVEERDLQRQLSL